MTYSHSLSQAGAGSIISIGATPTVIGEVTDFPQNRNEWDLVDVTNFESGLDGEQLPTIRKPATIDITINRVSSDAGQVLVESAYQSGALTAFTVTLPKTAAQTTSGDKVTFNAYGKGSNWTVKPDQAVIGKVTLAVSGAQALTVGS
jgi:hypothetical protein